MKRIATPSMRLRLFDSIDGISAAGGVNRMRKSPKTMIVLLTEDLAKKGRPAVGGPYTIRSLVDVVVSSPLTAERTVRAWRRGRGASSSSDD